jgi:hypothetical protein
MDQKRLDLDDFLSVDNLQVLWMIPASESLVNANSNLLET